MKEKRKGRKREMWTEKQRDEARIFTRSFFRGVAAAEVGWLENK